MTKPNYTEMMQTDSKTAAQALANDPAFVRELVQRALNTALEAEMTELLGAAKSERTGARRGYRSGSYPRSLSMKVGTVELKVPQDRDGRFSTAVFERYQRSEKALVSTLAEMYVKGGLDAQGGRDGGTAVRSRVFGDDDLEHGGGLGSVLDGVGGPTAAGDDGLSDPGRALREGPRSWHGECAGGADRSGD